MNDLMPLAVGFDKAAKLIGVSRATLYNMHNSGMLGPKPMKVGTRSLLSVRALSDWIDHRMPDRAKWQSMRNET